ncbi:MAG: hypothetical protein CMJ45_08030 [Planctomyces sp.]|nr:hypothetical protein [Planctomyces sp.]
MSWGFQDNPVVKEVVERLLSTAVWAPNHRLTEPWRFFVVKNPAPSGARLATWLTRRRWSATTTRTGPRGPERPS